MSAKPLQGIFTPNMVPLDDRGRIHEEELRRLVEWLIEKGVTGIYPNGSTGEFTRFSFEERQQIVRIIADQARGRVPILAGAAEANIDMVLEACRYYADLGCTAAAICGPYYYKLSQASVEEYFAELARRSPLDIVLYNIPQFSNEISILTVLHLCDFPRIVGIKDSSRDMPRFLNLINQVRSRRPDFSCLIGTEEMLMPALIMGADGGTIASSGVVPEVVMKLYRLTLNGQWEEARKIQFGLLDLINAMLFDIEFPEGFRVGMSLRGFQMGQSRQKLSPRSRCDVERVRHHIHCLLSEHGVVEEPAEGCVSPSLSLPCEITADQVQAIVQAVVTKLRQEGRV